MLLRADLFSALALPIGLGLILNADRGNVTPTVAQTVAHPVDVSFAEQIMPILEEHCIECHGAESVELGLNLTTYDGIMAGSDYGTIVEPGNPDGSVIIDMISSGDMPQDKDPLPAEKLELIRTWIAEGAQNN